MNPPRLLRSLSIALALTACGHDRDRDNPLDPALTPAVTLSVAVDDTTGTAALTWSRYAGREPFAAYQVVRELQGQGLVDTLAVIVGDSVTTFVDSTVLPEQVVAYRVVVVNGAGFGVPSNDAVVQPGYLAPGELLQVDASSTTATASLRWRAFRGAHFQAYRIRRTSPEAERVVGQLAVVTDTAFVDVGLHGNTPYTYAVDVLTTQGEVLAGEGRAALIHALVGSWPLDGPERAFVRLYHEQPGTIAALVSTMTEVLVTGRPVDWSSAVRLRSWSSDGEPLSNQGLSSTPLWYPQSVATALSPDGRRFLAFADRNGSVSIVEVRADGSTVKGRTPMFADTPDDFLTGPQAGVRGQVTLYAEQSGALVSKVVVRSDGQVVRADDFGLGRPSGWEFDTDFRRNTVETVETLRRDGVPAGWLAFGRTVSDLTPLAWTRDDGWRDLELEVDAVTAGRRLAVELGQAVDGSSRVRVTVDGSDNSVVLEGWSRSDGQERSLGTFTDRYPVLHEGPTFRLGLGVVDGRIHVWMESILRWETRWYSAELSELQLETFGEFPWLGLVSGTRELLISASDTRHALDHDGTPIADDGDWPAVSEARTWFDERGTEMLGICLPEEHHLRVRFLQRAGGQVIWPDAAGRVIVGAPGSGDGQLLFPLSFDVAPDGRIYVLDAGNSRIQVFHADGSYLTQWGTGRGPGDRQFDFGATSPGDEPAEQLFGSVAVDDEGFIYVADVLNRRLQKFAP